MDAHNESSVTCLSDLPHDNVLDVCLHYFGCLRYQQRIAYFEGLDRHDQKLITDRERRIQKVKDSLKQNLETVPLLHDLAESLHVYQNLRHNFKPSQYPRKLPTTNSIPRSCEGMSARLVLFKDTEPYSDPRCPQTWPDQKLPLEDLLYGKSDQHNPLMGARGTANKNNMIQWFHLPSNDMSWVEEAMSRYYHEDIEALESQTGGQSLKHGKNDILRREYWRGQQQGSDLDPTHARHMKPRCDVIPMNPFNATEKPPKNLVLYMPYMYWDTWRRTKIRSNITRTKERSYKSEREKKERERLEDFERQTKRLKRADGGLKRADSLPRDRPKISNRRSSILRLFRNSSSVQEDTSFPSTGRHLGRVLIQAAMLFEKMEYFHEEESLKLSLYAPSPLHPRRTLHQYRYGTKQTTEKLDKAQAIYCRTAPSSEYLHHPTCNEKDTAKCQHSHCEHEEKIMFRGCRQCFCDSQKLPRLIVVDQLWLWILDERTIITAFPRSWGRDPYSVHKRIRLRLKTLLPGEIQSAYDLALMIVDQCSGVIFERIRVIEKQPPVIDIFQDTIGTISDKQTLAATHFWRNVDTVVRLLKKQDKMETTTMYKLFLDVKREGKLLSEIGGILDELSIMLQIQDQQRRVLKGFTKHIARLLSAPKSRVEGISFSRAGSRRGSFAGLADLRAFGPQTPGIGLGPHIRFEDSFQFDSSGSPDPSKTTMMHARELAENLDDRDADLTGLETTARQISDSLNRLVDLKLQQAGVIQAQEASEEL